VGVGAPSTLLRKVRRSDDDPWIHLPAANDIAGVRAMKITTSAPWLIELCWGRKTSQTIDSDAMRSVINALRAAARVAVKEAASEEKNATIANAVRGKLAGDSSDDEADTQTDSQNKILGVKSVENAWSSVSLNDDVQGTIQVYPGHKCVYVPKTVTDIKAVVRTMQAERRRMKNEESPGAVFHHHYSQIATRLMTASDTGRISWSHNQKGYLIHYSAGPDQPKFSWKKVGCINPMDDTDDDATIEKNLSFTLTMARYKWNNIDRSDQERYELPDHPIAEFVQY